MDEGFSEEDSLKKVNKSLHITDIEGANAERRLGSKLNWYKETCSPEIAKIPQKHYLPIEYKEHCADKWERYYKLGIIRNPWEHVVSLYFMRRGNLHPNKYYNKFHKFCEVWFMDKSSLSYYFDNYFFIGDEMVLDSVVRFENYNEEMSKVWKKLFKTKMPFKLNKDKTKELWKERKLTDRPEDYRELYTGKGAKYIDAVRKAYPKTIEYFGYEQYTP
jgi:hypothetical protein